MPLMLLNLVTGAASYYALSVQPQGQWDENTLTGIETMCFVPIIAGLLTLGLTAAPAVKGLLSRWWLALPLVLTGTAAVRWVFIVQHYPAAAGS